MSIATQVGTLTVKTALEAVTAIKDALGTAGMPRTSRFNGGELTGWTEAFGSTGFSVRDNGDDTLTWHIVISGKPLLRYHTYSQDGDELHEPLDPEKLNGRIQAVFEANGLNVQKVDYSDHQTLWDDDVGYTVVTHRPEWLEAKPQKSYRRW